MPLKNDSLLRFLKDVEESFDFKEVSKNQNETVPHFPLNNLECVYLFDFTLNKIVFHQGFDKVFGFRQKELRLEHIFDRYHPEDKPYIQSIVRSVIDQLMKITIPEYSNILNLSYRYKREDGLYSNIMSNTIIYKTNNNDKVQQVLIKYTDISFTSESDALEWMVDTTYLDEDKIKQQVYGDTVIFTQRELEVIKNIFEGASNNEISAKLHISKHTVATHRKNILLKSNCHDTNQLKDFCKRKGITY